MKDLIINSAMNNVERNCSYDAEELAEIRYGLASLYLTLTKTIVIFSISYVLGDIKSLLILMIHYSILRLTGFGVHAKKSWHCWVSSLIIFLIIPKLCNVLVINYNVKLTLGIFCEAILIFFAPADTEKRPLINKKRRMTYKVISALLGLSYILSFTLIKDNLYSNCLLFAMVIEAFVILPITYKIFGTKYNNYKNYQGK